MTERSLIVMLNKLLTSPNLNYEYEWKIKLNLISFLNVSVSRKKNINFLA